MDMSYVYKNWERNHEWNDEEWKKFMWEIWNYNVLLYFKLIANTLTEHERKITHMICSVFWFKQWKAKNPDK